jgi:hypothetical protein
MGGEKYKFSIFVGLDTTRSLLESLKNTVNFQLVYKIHPIRKYFVSSLTTMYDLSTMLE